MATVHSRWFPPCGKVWGRRRPCSHHASECCVSQRAAGCFCSLLLQIKCKFGTVVPGPGAISAQAVAVMYDGRKAKAKHIVHLELRSDFFKPSTLGSCIRLRETQQVHDSVTGKAGSYELLTTGKNIPEDGIEVCKGRTWSSIIRVGPLNSYTSDDCQAVKFKSCVEGVPSSGYQEKLKSDGIVDVHTKNCQRDTDDEDDGGDGEGYSEVGGGEPQQRYTDALPPLPGASSGPSHQYAGSNSNQDAGRSSALPPLPGSEHNPGEGLYVTPPNAASSGSSLSSPDTAGAVVNEPQLGAGGSSSGSSGSSGAESVGDDDDEASGEGFDDNQSVDFWKGSSKSKTISPGFGGVGEKLVTSSLKPQGLNHQPAAAAGSRQWVKLPVAKSALAANANHHPNLAPMKPVGKAGRKAAAASAAATPQPLPRPVS